MSEELKPCPCGSPADQAPYAITPANDLYRLDCTRPECGWCVIAPSIEQAFIDWNTRVALKAGPVQCKASGDFGSDCDECAALKAWHGEAVAWQFFQDGKWWNGDERIKDHRTNTKAAGYPIRDLYTNPPASADAVSVAPGLERAIQIVREVAKTQPGYSDEREAIFEALSEAYVEAMAPPCTSAAVMSVSIGLLRNICSMVPEKMKPARKELRALLAQSQEVKS